jgi:hypothetical protein
MSMSFLNLVLSCRPKVGVSKDGYRRGRASGHPSRPPREGRGLLRRSAGSIFRPPDLLNFMESVHYSASR